MARKILLALVVEWDVAAVESEGELTEQAKRDIEAAEKYFAEGGKGAAHDEVLKEFGLR